MVPTTKSSSARAVNDSSWADGQRLMGKDDGSSESLGRFEQWGWKLVQLHINDASRSLSKISIIGPAPVTL